MSGGNKSLWRMVNPMGRPPKFESPEELWEKACGYFQWVEENPLWEEKLFHSQGEITKGKGHKMRAMTQEGLCLFLNITDETYRNYKEKENFFGVISQINKIIYEQKLTGAAADLLNSNIIARDLGLTDKKDVDHTSSDGSMTPKGFNDFYSQDDDDETES